MRRSLFLSLCAIAASIFVSPLLYAQQAAVAPRIVAPIDESRLTVLSGGVTAFARAEFDRGQAPASTPMKLVRLVLSRSPQQEAALRQFMAQQLDPSSPNYHKWLTPEQFGQLYGPSDSDIATLTSWLQSHGFAVEPVAPGRVSIAFSGSVSQIEAAFHTEIHSFNANGEEFLSNISNPKIPAALASVIAGIAQLNTIKPRPHHVPGPMGTYSSEQKHFVHAGENSSGPTPLLTGGSASAGYSLYVVAGDAATIYDTPNSFNANFSTGTSYKGTGVTIGIGGDAPIQGATVADYRKVFLGDSNQPIISNNTTYPATDTSDQDEAYIDTELSGALAPGATIHFYTSSNLTVAIEQAISENAVDIFSLSFGECEAGLTTADNQLINSWWQQFNSQGVAVTVSTGDSGSAACDNDNTEELAEYGLQVSGFASTPYNIAVGGTDYAALLSSFTTYVSTTNSSSTYYRTALSYIPESTWNDSSVTNTTISANAPYVDPTSGKTNIVGGNGGASSCSTNTNTSTVLTNCTSGYPKPSWQRGSGVPNDSVRDLPDVSLMAGNGFDTAAWLVCTDDMGSNGSITVTANCTTQSDGHFYFFGFGGTSTSAPAFAGILAMVQQKVGSRIGQQAAQGLYDLYNGSHASAVFHDITVGNISVPCLSGTPNCTKNTAGNYFLTGYNTATGYDLATGLGSVDATQLITYWGSATASATVAVTPASSSITTVQSLSVPVTVSGSSGTPTGTVTLTSGTYSSGAQTLASGAYTFTIPAGSLAVGSDTLSVSYSGDSTYGTATGSGSVTVSKATPTVTVTPSSSSIASNKSLGITVKVTGAGATPTGTVTLTAGSYTSSATSLSSGSATITIPANTLSAGTASISVSYSGDTVYATGSGSSSVTVTAPPAATVAVTPASSSITTVQSLSVPVTVSGSSGTPTGTVTLTSGTYSSGAQTLASGKFTFTIPAGSLAVGTDTLSVSYSGDSTYGTNTGSGSVTVSKAAPTAVTVTPASISISSTSSLAVTVKVTGAGATPTGTVTLTSGTYTSSATSLSSGSATITIPANTFTTSGSKPLNVSYSGDSVYTTGTGSSSVTVTVPIMPTVTVTPASSSVDSGQTLAVTVAVTGTGGTPTGTVTLSSGSYTSSATSLSSGSASITIPANTLAAGTDTLTASYSGDTVYAMGSGTASVTVTTSSFSLSGTTPASVSAGSGSSSTITATSSNNFSGTVAVTCSLTSSPTGAVHVPSCSVTGSPITLSPSTTSGTATVNFTTTAASAVGGHMADSGGWKKAGAATLLAFLVFLGIPARRRAWRAIVGVLVLLAALGTFSACGGGGGGSGNSGTTSGSYTFTVTGTPSVSGAASATTTVTLSVN
jgi:trimeric autotransporter adhesin